MTAAVFTDDIYSREGPMKTYLFRLKITSLFLAAAFVVGCASTPEKKPEPAAPAPAAEPQPDRERPMVDKMKEEPSFSRES